MNFKTIFMVILCFQIIVQVSTININIIKFNLIRKNENTLFNLLFTYKNASNKYNLNSIKVVTVMIFGE